MTFCNTCKHLTVGGGMTEPPIYDCMSPLNCKKKHNWLQEWLVPKVHPKKLNKNNNCGWFEAKDG